MTSNLEGKTWFDLLETPEGRDILADALRPRDADQEALAQKTAAIDTCEFIIDSPKYSDGDRSWARTELARLKTLLGLS